MRPIRIPDTFDARWFAALWQELAAAVPLRGAGSPEGVVAAPVGTLYLRTDGGASTAVYVKESGAASTGWVAK